MATLINIQPKSAKTQQYLRHVLAEMAKSAPFQQGELIEMRVVEDSTPFPKFTVMPVLSHGEEKMEIKIGRIIHENVKGLPRDSEIAAESFANTRVKQFYKFKQLIYYTFCKTEEACMLEVGDVELDYPMKVTLGFIVGDPKRLYREIERMGIEMPKDDEEQRREQSKPATFSDNPPQIHWLGNHFAIKPATMQYCLCKVMFNTKPKERVSWDEIADEIDDVPKDKRKTSRQRVYYVMRRLNDKIHAGTGKDLFVWDNLSLYRIA